jgi:hypothetical protein
MTAEEKELLLNDLCARLPYGVKANISLVGGDERIDTVSFNDMKDFVKGYINIKPYLRPMSSMTEEEIQEYVIAWDNSRQPYLPTEAIDWLNEHHFDYRGLIRKGLALEAPEDMYKI